MSVTNLRRLISVEYLSVYIRSSQHESAPVAFIARTAVDSDRLQGVTMYGQVVDRRRSPETKIFRQEWPPAENSPGFLFLFLTSYGVTSSFSLSPLSRVYRPEMSFVPPVYGPRPDNYVIDTLNAPWADYVNKQTRVANWVTRARKGSKRDRANMRE